MSRFKAKNRPSPLGKAVVVSKAGATMTVTKIELSRTGRALLQSKSSGIRSTEDERGSSAQRESIPAAA